MEILMEIHIIVVDILLKTKHFNLMWALEQTVTKDRRKHHRGIMNVFITVNSTSHFLGIYVWTKVINTAMVV